MATITFSVTVNNPDAGNGSLASTVTSATVGNNCPVSGGADPACTVAVAVVNASTLTFTTTADTAAPAAGGVVHYTITATNSGLTAYNGATFTAGLGGVLDDASYDNDAAATAGTATFTSPTLTWTGNVPASGTVTITYSVTVNSPDTGNHVLASTITSSSIGSNCGTGSADPRCTATVPVAALSITATADVSTVSPGSDVTLHGHRRQHRPGLLLRHQHHPSLRQHFGGRHLQRRPGRHLGHPHRRQRHRDRDLDR